MSLYQRLVSCAYFLHISHFSILPIFSFPLQSSLTLLAATTNVSTTASQSVSLSVSVSCECLSVSVSSVADVCVSNVVLAKESLETLCFAVSQWQNLHRSLFMFFFLPTFLGHANRHSDASDSVGSFG